jgi:uncharacterized protein YecT (DUF1311 family)
MFIRTLAAALSLAAGHAAAQDVDCSAELSMVDMTICADDKYAAADAAMNAAYDSAVAIIQSGQGSGNAETEGYLRAAQKTWVAFREAECGLQASFFDGGTMQPMIELGCLATLTEERTAALIEFTRTL